MPYDEAKKMVEGKGFHSFLVNFQTKYPSYKLYSTSTRWIKDSQYICKLKGARGDLVIGWTGIHEKTL
jgi:hypothetical protein